MRTQSWPESLFDHPSRCTITVSIPYLGSPGGYSRQIETGSSLRAVLPWNHIPPLVYVSKTAWHSEAFPWFQVSCNSGSGGSQRRTQAGHCALCYAVTERPSLAVIGKEAVSLYPVLRSLRDPTLVSLRDPLPLTRLSTISKSMAKGRGSLPFQISYPRERFEEKNYRQIPQGMLRYAAPPSCGSKHRATPAAGARKDKLRPVTTRLVPRFLYHSLCGHCKTLCQRAICFQAPSSMAKGRGSLHFQTSYPRERFEEKNYRQIPQGMLRYAAPPSCVLLSFVQLRQRGSQRRTQAGHTPCSAILYHSLCGHCKTLPTSNMLCFPGSMAKGRGSLHFQTSYQGNASERTTCRLPRPFPCF